MESSRSGSDDARDPKALFEEALRHHQAGRWSEAEAAYRRLIARQGDDAAAHSNLGDVLLRQGRLEEARVELEAALELAPEAPAALSNLGHVLVRLGEVEAGADVLVRAAGVDPADAAAHYKQAVVAKMLGRREEALAHFDRAVALDPGHAAAQANLALLLAEVGRRPEAISRLERAIEKTPDLARARIVLARLLHRQARVTEAVDHLRSAIEVLDDSPSEHSSLLLLLHYVEGEPNPIFREHRRFAERHERPLATSRTPHANDRDPERRLRVGYLSPDFRGHAVASFIEPIVVGHDRGRFEVTLYADVTQPDETTRQYAALADRWRDVSRMSDEQVAAGIRDDGIDVLVDLAGHTARNRVLVLARKPAPVQVTYLGYPDTTGLDAVDYRLTDRWADPEGESDEWNSEALVRLPSGFLCYAPPPEAPDVAPLPAAERGLVTFGSFNNLAKVTEEVVAVWSAILECVPASRLLLKAGGLDETDVRERYVGLFERHGVSADRVSMVGYLDSPIDHVARYAEVDIGLDTFPYNGATTTCEALFMGVPVVSLKGRTHAGRVGVSLLERAGLPHLIADSADDYVGIARRLADNLESLGRLRRDLRPRMLASPVCDRRAITRAVEEAFRSMWRQYCSGRGSYRSV